MGNAAGCVQYTKFERGAQNPGGCNLTAILDMKMGKAGSRDFSRFLAASDHMPDPQG